MFAQERQEEILRLINGTGSGVVKDLASRFSVTEDCIRKDLALLERRGLLQRTYGGAVPVRRNPHLFEVRARRKSDVAGKERIAGKAADLVSDGDTVFLDISTVNLEIVKELARRRKKITVVTNMTDLIPLAGEAGLPLICPGGRLNKTGDGFTGAATAESLTRFKFDLGFFGAVGMDMRALSAYTYDMEDGDVKAAALRCCKRAFLVAQREKFRQDGNYRWALLSDFEGILLDGPPEADIAAVALENGVNLL